MSTERRASSRAISALRREARACTNCSLYQHATQTVFGEGRPGADLMLVGEQPGSEEDLSGQPFVGPAGKLLEKALEKAGLQGASLYVTNAVKHFKWKPRGKRRLHQKPNLTEIEACFPWLEAEIDAIRPKSIVCLGATAARSVLGRSVPVSDGPERSRMFRMLCNDLLRARSAARDPAG